MCYGLYELFTVCVCVCRLQVFLNTYGIQTQTPQQVEPIQIWPQKELVKVTNMFWFVPLIDACINFNVDNNNNNNHNSHNNNSNNNNVLWAWFTKILKSACKIYCICCWFECCRHK